MAMLVWPIVQNRGDIHLFQVHSKLVNSQRCWCQNQIDRFLEFDPQMPYRWIISGSLLLNSHRLVRWGHEVWHRELNNRSEWFRSRYSEKRSPVCQRWWKSWISVCKRGIQIWPDTNWRGIWNKRRVRKVISTCKREGGGKWRIGRRRNP